MDWAELKITIPAAQIDLVGGIANMVVPYGIYIEDYSNLEAEAHEIAHIDLIDEDLRQKDRTKGIIHIYISPMENPKEAIAFLRERFQAGGIAYELQVGASREEDWENNWKQYFKPLPVGEKLLIQPIWEEKIDAGGRFVVHLEPGQAFGTGSHATTRLCMQVLEEAVKPGCTVLDIGCGSGILSIAALLLGASHATGVDIDPYAVKTAQENGRANGMDKQRFNVLHGNLTQQVQGKFDVIAANIVADVLVRLASEIPGFLKPDGVFLASGIILPSEEMVRAAFEANGLCICERNESEEWICLTAKLA